MKIGRVIKRLAERGEEKDNKRKAMVQKPLMI